MNQLIAGEVILGASIGTVSVAYAGMFEAPIEVDEHSFVNHH